MVCPKVSVVMTTYNSSDYLAEAVESILNQTFSNIEFIIVDDGSTDRTWDLLLQYAASDRRILLVKNEENLGPAKSSNKGLSIATGEYIARFDSDDVSFPNRLQEQVDYMEANPSIALISTPVEHIDITGKHLGYYSPPTDSALLAWKQIFGSPLRHPTAFWRRKLVESSVGIYNPEFRYALDYEFFVRVSKTLKVNTLPIVLLKMRQNPKSISFTKRNLQDDFAAQVTYQQLDYYLEKFSLSDLEKVDLRALLRRYSPIQDDQFKNLDRERLSRALENYLLLVKNFRPYYAKQNAVANFQYFTKDIEKEIPHLVNHCLNKHWNILAFKFIWNYLEQNPFRLIPLMIKLSLYLAYCKFKSTKFIQDYVNQIRLIRGKLNQNQIIKNSSSV